MIGNFVSITLVVLLGILSSFSGSRELNFADHSDRIYWSATAPLTWEDFKGSPDWKNRFASAISSTGIIYKYRCSNGIISVSVESMFIKSESWVKSAALTSYHLKHEQLHFDITELYARKLRKELNQRIYYCGEEKLLEKLVNTKLSEWDTEQKVYDKQTRHSLNEESQVVWNEFVQSQLDAYQEYSSDIYSN